jgi:hypothetical protein
MNLPTIYQIRVKDHIDDEWAEWFTPLQIVNEPNGEATFTGPVRDQSELQGLIDKVFNLNLTLLAVSRITNLPE